MPDPFITFHREAVDGVLAGSLIAAPAWVPPLSSVNEALTTLTLLLGVVLGAARLWQFLRERRRRGGS